jgi:Zn-dependent protease
MLAELLARFPWAIFLTRGVLMIPAFTLHEFAHALTATLLGDPTPREQGRFTLDPRRHMEHIGYLLTLVIGFGWSRPVHTRADKMHVPDALGGAITALAGPVANLLLAGIGVAVMRGLHLEAMIPLTHWPTLAEWLTVFVNINVAIALFNLLPLFPLDGWALIHAVLPLNGIARWEAFSGRTTLILGVGIVVVLLMPAPWLNAAAAPILRGINVLLFGS